MAWATMDSAPKDGTQIDLWVVRPHLATRWPDCWWKDGKWVTWDERFEETMPVACGAAYWMKFQPPEAA
jgi:hypothetical protein